MEEGYNAAKMFSLWWIISFVYIYVPIKALWKGTITYAEVFKVMNVVWIKLLA